MSYIYIQSEPACWKVGFYDPDGEWQSESDHSTPDGAWARVAYLNGGGDALELRGAIRQLKERVTMLEMGMIDLKTAAAFAPQIEHLRGQMDELETLVYGNALMKKTLAGLQEVVAELEGEDDPFMPPDEVWQWLPDAKCVAVDKSGAKFWYGADIEAREATWGTVGIGLMDAGFGCLGSRDLNDADWRTTKRTRPAHL